MANEVVYEDMESSTPVGLETSVDNATPPAKATEQAEEPKHSPKDMAALNRRIQELESSERYWADKAKSGSPAPVQKQADGPDELEALLTNAGIDDDTAASLLDDLGEKGVSALQKRGVITMAQLKPILAAVERRMEAKAESLADGKITSARGQMTAEAKLVKEYPELSDPKSALSIATAKEFAEMVAEDPSLQHSYTALGMAAKLARSQSGSSGMSMTDRMRQIAAQGPARGSRSAGYNEFDDDGDVAITPEAQTFINAGAKYGLTQEAYKKHAKRVS